MKIKKGTYVIYIYKKKEWCLTKLTRDYTSGDRVLFGINCGGEEVTKFHSSEVEKVTPEDWIKCNKDHSFKILTDNEAFAYLI